MRTEGTQSSTNADTATKTRRRRVTAVAAGVLLAALGTYLLHDHLWVYGRCGPPFLALGLGGLLVVAIMGRGFIWAYGGWQRVSPKTGAAIVVGCVVISVMTGMALGMLVAAARWTSMPVW